SVAVYHPEQDTASVDAWRQPGALQWIDGAPTVLIVFYRAHLQSGNTQVFKALSEQLLARGMNPLPLALLSLKDAACMAMLHQLCTEHQVSLILNTTTLSQSSPDKPDYYSPSVDSSVKLELMSDGIDS